MSIQPKLELDPLSMVTINDHMTIQAMVAQLRVTNVWEDYDKLEEILLSREKRANQTIGELKEKIEIEKLAKLHALEEFQKREEMCEKGKKIKEAYETLLKNVKTAKFAERETIEKMRKNNAELESEVFELRKLKDKCVEVTDLRKKNGELESELIGFRKLGEKLIEVSNDNAEIRKKNGYLESEVTELRRVNEKCVEVSNDNTELRRKNGELETKVCELMKLKGKLVDENTQLRSMICVLEGERDTLAALVRKDGELEEEVKRKVATIDELKKENRKLEEEKCKYHKQVQSLGKKFEELQVRVVKLEDDTVLLKTVDVPAGGGNNEEEVSLQRNEEIHHSLGAAAGTDQLLSKVIKEEKGSSARGRLESQKVIETIDLDDYDDDECTSRVYGKKAVSGITMRNEYPSSSKEIRQKNSFSMPPLEMMRNITFSHSDTSTSSGSSASSLNLDDLPFSPAQLQAKRRKT